MLDFWIKIEYNEYIVKERARLDSSRALELESKRVILPAFSYYLLISNTLHRGTKKYGKRKSLQMPRVRKKGRRDAAIGRNRVGIPSGLNAIDDHHPLQ